MVVDDLKVLDGAAVARRAEVDLRLGFASALGVHGEVRGFVDLDTWRDTRAALIWIRFWTAILSFLSSRTRSSFSPWICSALSCDTPSFTLGRLTVQHHQPH